MTTLFHLAFIGRHANQDGDNIIFTDGLPPPSDEELSNSYDAALAAWNEGLAEPPKSWINAQKFIEEFNMQEMILLANSTNPILAALRFKLSTWFGSIDANHPDVIMGLDEMVKDNIIDEAKKTSIITP